MHIKKHLLTGAVLLATTFGASQIVQSAPRAGKVITKTQIAISSPKNNASVDSPLTVRGTAPKNQKVGVNITAVYDGGQRSLGTMNTTANGSGHWTTWPIQLLLPKNAKNAHFKIAASYKVGKQTHTSSIIKVQLKQKLVPVRPNIEAQDKLKPRPNAVPVKPHNYVKPDITYPTAGLYLTMPFSYSVKGKATPNRNVKVTVIGKWTEGGRSKSRQIDQKTVRTASNGKWTVKMCYESVGVNYPASYDVIAEDIAFPDKDKVTVYENIKPTIQFPHANEEWTANGNYIISGKAGPDHQLKLSITAHWVQISASGARNNQQRVIAHDTVQVNSQGRWTTRQRFEPIGFGSHIGNPYYIINVEDTANRTSDAVTVKERK